MKNVSSDYSQFSDGKSPRIAPIFNALSWRSESSPRRLGAIGIVTEKAASLKRGRALFVYYTPLTSDTVDIQVGSFGIIF